MYYQPDFSAPINYQFSQQEIALLFHTQQMHAIFKSHTSVCVSNYPSPPAYKKSYL